jgi:glucokinase
LEQFSAVLSDIARENGITYKDIRGIGISCGGPLDSEKGVIMSPPNLPGWDDIKICEYFESRTGVPCRLQNDANACAVAEWKYGAGKGLKDMVFLTFGTGLGAGLILDSHLYRGHSDMAGEIGHVRLEEDGPVGYGKAGSAEGFCSGGGIRQLGIRAMLENGEDSALYKACEGNPDNVNAKIIADLADSGDEICKGVYDKCAEKLGFTAAVLCDILNPQAIIIGGIYMRSANLLEEGIMRVMQKEALVPCKIMSAGLSENVGDYAALSIADGNY